MHEPRDESDAAWDPAGQEREQRRRDAAMTLDAKLAWLEEAHAFARELQQSLRTGAQPPERRND